MADSASDGVSADEASAVAISDDCFEFDAPIELTEAPRRRCKVVVVDSHPVILIAMEQILDAKRGFRLVGTARNGKTGLKAVKALKPDIVITDLHLPRLDGIGLIREIEKRSPDVHVLVMADDDDPDSVLDALDAGASGYLLRTAESDEIQVAIRACCRGEVPISPVLTRRVLSATRAYLSPLSDREVQVLRLAADGLANKQIARHLGISEKTVKSHLTQVFKRIGVTDRVAATAWAARNLPGRSS
jgi:DNA-binding NarL/FixJ family response regulator